MPIEYPWGPCPPNPTGGMLPGEGIRAAPFEAESILEITLPFGKGSGLLIGMDSQLGKWGFVRSRVEHSIEVSPVFTEYYQRTIEERKKLEAQIKEGFASLGTAIQDYELVHHDLRKYKEYLDYFKELEEAKKKKDPEEIKKALHVFRAIFVDQVDFHTGEGISLRSIAPRWPTIIPDFMELTDEDDTPDKIMKKLGIAKAEAVILATKNKLFVEWRDNLFLPTIKERYERLLSMSYSRKKSIEEYRKQIKPTLSRYKTLAEMRESPGGRLTLERLAFLRPESQAISMDTLKIWAWKPFVAPEIFKAPRRTHKEISLRRAGFNKEEIKELAKKGIKSVPALPAEPIVDKWVRKIKEEIEKEHSVKIGPEDIVEAIDKLDENYKHPERHLRKKRGEKAVPWPAKIGTGTKVGPRWPFSPYFIFVEIPITKTVIRTPDGSISEDLWIEPLMTWTETQNIILSRLLEIKAMDKKLEMDISLMLGEYGQVGDAFKKMDEILKEEYPEIYEVEEKEEKKTKMRKVKEVGEGVKKVREALGKIRAGIGKFFSDLGIDLMFIYPGTYEKLMFDRMSKMYQLGPGKTHGAVTNYLKKGAGVPGV